MMPFTNQLMPALSLEELLRKIPLEKAPLEVIALALASHHSRDVDFRECLSELDGIADEARVEARTSGDPQSLLSGLRRVLFEHRGFQGNREDYYAPENSFLHNILETRRGNPITLSLLMIETGRRIGLHLVGIGLPCHFMVGYPGPDGLRLFDPFHRGEERSQQGCIDLIRDLSGGSVSISPADFIPVTKHLFVTRMLCNLRGIYRQREDLEHLAITLRHLLLLNPEDANIHYELALTQARLGDLSGAAHHLTAFSHLTGDKTGIRRADEVSKVIRSQLELRN
jgi:regulator of sirC expression with transglutaminase-like and TPR domain